MTVEGTHGNLIETAQLLLNTPVWATWALLRHSAVPSEEVLQTQVAATDGSILHTLTDIAGSQPGYLAELSGRPAAETILQGVIPPLGEPHARFQALVRTWVSVLEHREALDVMPPRAAGQPATAHSHDRSVLQTAQYGVDHRTLICTALSTLGSDAPALDGWADGASEPAARGDQPASPDWRPR